MAALHAAHRVESAAKTGISYRDFGRLVTTTEAALRRYVADRPGLTEIDESTIEEAADDTLGTLKASLAVWRLRYEDCDNVAPNGDKDMACNYIILNAGGQNLGAKGAKWIRKMAERSSLLYERLDRLPVSAGQPRTGQLLKKAFHDNPHAGVPFKFPGYKPMRGVRISALVPSLLSWDAGSADLFITAVNITPQKQKR